MERWQLHKRKQKHGKEHAAAVNYVVNRTLYFVVYYLIIFSFSWFEIVNG